MSSSRIYTVEVSTLDSYNNIRIIEFENVALIRIDDSNLVLKESDGSFIAVYAKGAWTGVQRVD